MSEHRDLKGATRDLGAAARVFGRALPITRGAAFYVTIVLLLVVFVYHKDQTTAASLARTQAGICTVIDGASASEARTAVRLESAVQRSRTLLHADNVEVGVWRVAARREVGEHRRLDRRLFKAWSARAKVDAAAVTELRAERAAAAAGRLTFPGC